MKKIKAGKEDLVELVGNYQNSDYYSNAFFTKSSLEELAHNLLACYYDENQLYLIEDRYNHKKLTYFIKKGFLPEKTTGQTLAKHKPLFLELVYRKNEDIGELLGVLEEIGFEKYILRVRYRGTNKKLEKLEVEEKAPGLTLASKEDFREIYDIYLENFEPYTSNLSDLDRILLNIREGGLYLIKEDGKIVGILETEKDKKTLSIEHLVTSASHRGRGLGKVLLNKYIDELKENDYRSSFWVQVDNKSALANYERAGFKRDRIYSQSMKLR